MLSGRGLTGSNSLECSDDVRDRLLLSVRANNESLERKDDVAEEIVLLLDRAANIVLRLMCSVYARIFSGDGGPSIAVSNSDD